MSKHRDIKINDVFNDLKVIKDLGRKKYYSKTANYYLCKCLICGKEIELAKPLLGNKKNCGCSNWLPRKIIEPGTKFNHLTVKEISKRVKGRGYLYACECDCGNNRIIEVRRDNLLDGIVTSCGCANSSMFEKNRKKAYKKIFIESTNLCMISSNKPQKNNTSGYKGVSWSKTNSKWQARIQFQGKSYFLGYYDDINVAAEVRQQAETEIQKDFWKWYEEHFPKDFNRIKIKKYGK